MMNLSLLCLAAVICIAQNIQNADEMGPKVLGGFLRILSLAPKFIPPSPDSPWATVIPLMTDRPYWSNSVVVANDNGWGSQQPSDFWSTGGSKLTPQRAYPEGSPFAQQTDQLQRPSAWNELGGSWAPPVVTPGPPAYFTPRPHAWREGQLRQPTAQPQIGPQVTVLLTGHLIRLANGQFYQRSTITLVQDEGRNILVDTGLATDTFELVKALSNLGMTPDNIDMVVVTHGHLDHVGNQNFFSHKTIFFDIYEHQDDKYFETALKKAPYRRLTTNTELWKTPGHTNQDVTLVVQNYQGNSTLAIVGDLILSEEYLRSPKLSDAEPTYNWNLQVENVNAVVCSADYIVPGHGPMFWVRPEYRAKANCDAKTIQKFGMPPYTRRDTPMPSR